MSKTSYICNCDVIHEDIVNDVKSKMLTRSRTEWDVCMWSCSATGGNKICNFASVKGITPSESGKIP